MKNILQGVVGGLYVLSMLALAVDSYGAETTFSDRMGFSSLTMASVALLLMIAIRWLRPFVLNKVLGRMLLILGIFLIVVSSILIISVAVTPDNYLYSYTHLQNQNLLVAGVFSILTWLLFQSTNWWRKKFYLLILGGLIFFLLAVRLLSFVPYDYLLELVKEDNFFEWWQVIILVLSLILSMLLAREAKEKNVRVMWIMVGCVFLLVILDEISYGQRLFGVATPMDWQSRNTQGEINFHNDELVSPFITQGYAVIGFLGTTLWWWKERLKLRWGGGSLLKLITPSRGVAWYFLVLALYNFFVLCRWFEWQPLSNIVGYRGFWSEPIELVFYLGVFFTILESGKLRLKSD